MKICFLVHGMYGLGGTVRMTLNTASALAARGHEVEIISVRRHRETPRLPFNPAVPVRPLVDIRNEPAEEAAIRGRDLELLRTPSSVFPRSETQYHEYNSLTDARVAEFLNAGTADIYVGTRPGLNCYLARFAPASAVVVGQEHMFHDYHSPSLRARLAYSYRRLDALVTVTEADAATYRHRMPHLKDRIIHIPNAIPPTATAPSTNGTRVIVAAGRLEKVKRYNLLLEAFAKFSVDFDDWTLRIYGVGSELPELRRHAARLGVLGRVQFMGVAPNMASEWPKGSIAALTSEYESFGLTMVEAMAAGLPVVSATDRMGPAEILEDGVDGLLVGDSAGAIAAGLGKLAQDESLRVNMGRRARAKAERFSLSNIAIEHECLFERLSHYDPMRRMRKRIRNLRHAVNSRKVRRAYPTDRQGTTTSSDIVNCRSVSFQHIEFSLPSDSPARTLQLRLRPDHAPVSPKPIAATQPSTWLLNGKQLHDMPPGRWQVEIDGRPATPGVVETRNLVDVPNTKRHAGAVAVPAAEAGALSVRVWNRKLHAEIDDVRWEGDRLVIVGMLHGKLRALHDAKALIADRADLENASDIASNVNGDGHFNVSAPIDQLATYWAGTPTVISIHFSRPDAPPASRQPLRRIFTDVLSKRNSMRLPSRTEIVDGVEVVFEPYFTSDSRLAVNVTSVEPR